MIYTLTPCTSEDFPVCYSIRLNPDDAILKAHFPGQPIVPGAVLIQLAADAVSAHLNHDITIETMRNVKFLKAVTPDMSGDGLRITATIESGKALATITSKGVKLAVMTFTFR